MSTTKTWWMGGVERFGSEQLVAMAFIGPKSVDSKCWRHQLRMTAVGFGQATKV